MIYETPDLTSQDTDAMQEIEELRGTLASYLRTPRRWMGNLRRTAVARAIQGSNSIEGYDVELDDADAALDGDGPISADERTYREIVGYRQALGFVLATAADEHFELHPAALRSMHYMLLSHDLSKSPGRFRRGEIFVSEESTGRHVFQGPDAERVPALVAETLEAAGSGDGNPFVRAAMAHLNLVMVHPFRDGNGRMARALQTLVLTREGFGAPELSSIEEWLGANTSDYYRALARSSDGAWSPGTDASLWVSFCLRAHHLQAQTVVDRLVRTERVWARLDDLAAHHRLPDRTLDILYSAVLGMRVRRAPYVRVAEVDARTATRDLKALTDAGLLRPVGNTAGRYYVAGPSLGDVVAERRRAGPLREPFPRFLAELYDA